MTCVGIVRIGVSPYLAGLHRWGKLQRKAHMHPRVAATLEAVGREAGADPGEWYGTFRPVSIDEWTAVEGWVEGQWVPIFEKQEIEEE